MQATLKDYLKNRILIRILTALFFLSAWDIFACAESWTEIALCRDKTENNTSWRWACNQHCLVSNK